VLMQHLDVHGRPKLVERCTLPLTGRRVVDRVITDLAVIDVGPAGFVLRELAPGVEIDDVAACTAAPLLVPAPPTRIPCTLRDVGVN
jgi:3-oxoacid CoA-transferase subunit B